MSFFFIYLHVSLGHLFIKLLGVNLTPLVYDAALLKMSNTKKFLGQQTSSIYIIKFIKFHCAAVNGIATGTFQKYNWGPIDRMVDRELIYD